jgi:hypothetical protein
MNVISLSTAQRRAIDRARETLVAAAETLLDESGVKPSKDFGQAQLRNLLAVASETESPAVVLNFIRYQMGRDKKDRKGWAHGGEGARLGERFIAALGDGPEAAVGAALARVPGLTESPEAKQLARIELMRHFIGFASRYMRYLDLQKGDAGEENRR